MTEISAATIVEIAISPRRPLDQPHHAGQCSDQHQDEEHGAERSAAAPGRWRLPSIPATPFRYHHEGSLAQIGKRKAVIDFGWIKLRGAIAWWLWGIAHIYFLVGVRSWLSVALNWLWVYLRNQRGARLITQADSETKPD